MNSIESASLLRSACDYKTILRLRCVKSFYLFNFITQVSYLLFSSVDASRYCYSSSNIFVYTVVTRLGGIRSCSRGNMEHFESNLVQFIIIFTEI